MRIEIRTTSFTLTDGLREHIERRVQFALSWADHKLQKINLNLKDINGPKGGSDKSCRVQIPVTGAGTVVVEEVQADLYVAIDRAIDRASRALARKIKREREHGRVHLEPVDH